MITIFGQHGCDQCRTAKMLLDRKNIEYDYIISVMPIAGVEYPQIFVDDEELTYQTFLAKVKNGEIK